MKISSAFVSKKKYLSAKKKVNFFLNIAKEHLLLIRLSVNVQNNFCLFHFENSYDWKSYIQRTKIKLLNITWCFLLTTKCHSYILGRKADVCSNLSVNFNAEHKISLCKCKDIHHFITKSRRILWQDTASHMAYFTNNRKHDFHHGSCYILIKIKTFDE